MRALVLSGGGARGAYQVGTILHLLGDLNLHYDIVCGISVGALNGAFISMFKQGEEALASKELVAMWRSLDSSHIFTQWPEGRKAFFKTASFYDSQPLLDLIHGNILMDKIRVSGKKLCVGAVCLANGVYRTFGEMDELIVKAVAASSSYPGFFRPIEIEGALWTDGGVRIYTPFQEALDLGATTIDVVTTRRLRSLDRFEAPPGIQVNVLAPSGVLLKNSLDFSRDKISRNIDIGYEEAKDRDW